MRKSTVTLALALWALAMMAPLSVSALTPDLPADFCGVMNDVEAALTDEGPSGLAWLGTLLGEDAALLDQLKCATADLNGPLVNDLPSPNGMLDAEFELGVLQELLNNPTPYQGLSSGTLAGQVAAGVDPDDVMDAYLLNYANLYTPGLDTVVNTSLPALWPILQAAVPGVPAWSTALGQTLSALFPNLMSVIAGFATLGDTDSMTAVIKLANLLAFCDLIQEGSCLVTDIVRDAALYETLDGILGPEGDADGDGFSNRDEYDAFALAKTAADYVQAALSPGITPGGTEGEGEGEVEIDVTGPSLIEAGDRVVLKAVTPVTVLGYVWSRSNSQNTGYVDIPDETGSSLIFESVEEQNEGFYRVTISYDDGTKATVAATSGSHYLEVVPEGTLPLAGGLGIAVLAGACAFAGAVGIRRKK